MRPLITAISFIIIFDILVFVHEFGHFIMARKNGVKVHEFALGMGPILLKKQMGDTLYALRAFPIGGFCLMEGEDSDVEGPDSFNSKTPWQRFQIIVMGAVNNILLAFIVMLILNLATGVPTSKIETVTPNSAAALAGIEPGAVVMEVNGEGFSIWPEASMLIAESKDEVKLLVYQNETVREKILKPELNKELGRKVIGISVKTTKNVGGVVGYTTKEMGYFAKTIIRFFKQLFTGKADLNQVSGPVGLVKVVDETAQYGITSLLFLLSLISLNLGVFNLLPLPALDGGRLLFILIEMLRGKPVPPEKEGLVHQIGFILLILFIVFITYKDIVKLL
ncbi:RIP metalloprotease RseP [Guggenheimella bovis]